MEFNLIIDSKAVEQILMVFAILEKMGRSMQNLNSHTINPEKSPQFQGDGMIRQVGIQDDKHRNSAIKYLNYTSDGAIYDDLRIKRAKLQIGNYPYTVEYDSELIYNRLIGYPE